MENWGKRYLGELIGTYLLVFVGVGAVFAAVYEGVFADLLPIMFLWGFAAKNIKWIKYIIFAYSKNWLSIEIYHKKWYT